MKISSTNFTRYIGKDTPVPRVSKSGLPPPSNNLTLLTLETSVLLTLETLSYKL